jgi:sec-independent protein translocase protein TatB
MLPGLGFSEIVVLALIALIVVGPKDLPLMLRKLGQWTRKLQAMANEFRQGFDELARQAELDELRKEVDALRRGGPISDLAREASDLEREMSTPMDIDPAATATTYSPPTEPPHDGGAAADLPIEENRAPLGEAVDLSGAPDSAPVPVRS